MLWSGPLFQIFEKTAIGEKSGLAAQAQRQPPELKLSFEGAVKEGLEEVLELAHCLLLPLADQGF